MFAAVRWAGLVVGVVAAALVYADAGRRGVARRRSLAVAVGAIAAGGFLAPSLLYETVYRGYPGLSVVRAPRALYAGMLATGLAVAAGAILVYGLAARLRESAPATRRERAGR